MDLSDRSVDNQTAVTAPPIAYDNFQRRPSAIYAGIAVSYYFTSRRVTLAVAVHDSLYMLDYAQHNISSAREYQYDHAEKFIGLAMSTNLAEWCPDLCARLWLELDIIPIVLRKVEEKASWGSYDEQLPFKSLDEQAEFFGPSQAPALEIGSRGVVEVDAAFHVKLTRPLDYQTTVGPTTWSAVNKFANDLKKRRVKIASFSATPQGGGVALMRHALVRLAKVLGVDLEWYVPKPRPGVFRITKNNHNILQGVAPPGMRFTPKERDAVRDWVHENADRFWFKRAGPPAPEWLEKHASLLPQLPVLPWFQKNGPLVHPIDGGANVIIIDDPQLPFLIPLIKKRTPDRPVIYRSHIQIGSDLVATPSTPQAEAWELLWESIKQADLFISHPVRAFVPKNVPLSTVGYMPASTDWLDGLTKPMSDWDISYYGRIFNSQCREQHMPTIQIPEEEYIAQIVRFDPSKGICDVLVSYERFHKLLYHSFPDWRPPKLLICGHGSVDDPDGTIVYDTALEYVDHHLNHLKHLICIVRIGPSDQMLNALLSKAKIALQLSTREGFEIKVSEALHKGKPVIATLAGGIPLQIQHGKNGFLVDVSDTDAVAENLFHLWTDQKLYGRMSEFASTNVSDEEKRIQPNERWINDMAREEANEPYQPLESRLKRAVHTSEAK
ncbi:related to trehalose synthase (Ccg-9) [Fusarium oxysporum]|uniref:Related to trehalose synthase (Ccg-9) n=1 Tax=Fusarium oxysporum TaxID=5507 RepID=A0A2H3SW70_FUSOX|nr:related to trehalose synthase (Ccg-9) [Fusarium oxysporum]